MPRSSEDVGAAWGRLVGVAVNVCKSHHTAHCECEPTRPFIPGNPRKEKKGPDDEPDSVIDSIGMSPVQQCESATTGHQGELIVAYEQTGSMIFSDVVMNFLEAGQALSTVPVYGQTFPTQMTGPGKVTVTIGGGHSRGLYVGHSQTALGVKKPVLIYIDDVIP